MSSTCILFSGANFSYQGIAQLELQASLPLTAGIPLVSLAANPTYIQDIQNTVVAWPPAHIIAIQTDAGDSFTIPLSCGGAPGTVVRLCLMFNGLPAFLCPSNPVEVTILP